jgi:two-component system response regulator CpxR
MMKSKIIPGYVRSPATQLAPEPPAGGSAPARILVVDAEPNATSALAELLGDEGYDVYCADSGASAQVSLQELCPDLLLTGLQLPGAQSLEEAATQLSTAIVRMLATGPARADGSAVLLKPIDVGELLAMVEGALAGRHSR